jgi:hypothetical protein
VVRQGREQLGGARRGFEICNNKLSAPEDRENLRVGLHLFNVKERPLDVV